MAGIEGAPRCKCCGEASVRLTRVWLCDECVGELVSKRAERRNDIHRLARTVTTCARSLASIILCCTKVLLSGGKDKESMARAMDDRDAIDEFDRALKELWR